MEELAAQVREEHLKTGRRIVEILEAMRDEGYISLDDADMVVCAALASRPQLPN